MECQVVGSAHKGEECACAGCNQEKKDICGRCSTKCPGFPSCPGPAFRCTAPDRVLCMTIDNNEVRSHDD